MLLEEIMSRDLVTLTEANTIHEAFDIMRKHHIRHLPIVDEQQHLVGLVSNQDIRDATPSIFRSTHFLEDLQQPLKAILKKDVITGHPLDFVEDVAAVFYENKIGCMPVLLDGKLVGIVTETDLLHTFVKLTGANQPGSHIQIKVRNKPGILSDVAAIFKEKKVNIHSVLVYPAPDNDLFKILVIRVQTMNPSLVIKELRDKGYDIQWPEIPGMPL
ncbi:acetoin utilization AcuB family protein [Bacillus testis]|uniref:acetoin utilization AcuB family protein n=1 Tax=Bacillus testis TaxID=1622072 RepID=UPI00067E893B|nr:acetoin utilization AcuB family protein [Bacillus testis]